MTGRVTGAVLCGRVTGRVLCGSVTGRVLWRESVEYGGEFGGTVPEVDGCGQVPLRRADAEPTADEPPVLLGGPGEVTARIRAEDGVPQALLAERAGGAELPRRVRERLDAPTLQGQLGGGDGRVLQKGMAENVRSAVAGQGSRAGAGGYGW